MSFGPFEYSLQSRRLPTSDSVLSRQGKLRYEELFPGRKIINDKSVGISSVCHLQTGYLLTYLFTFTPLLVSESINFDPSRLTSIVPRSGVREGYS